MKFSLFTAFKRKQANKKTHNNLKEESALEGSILSCAGKVLVMKA